MESEMNSIRANGTWDLVESPWNRKALPCKWVFQLKQVSDSSDPKYKARIVAKGFRQEYGVDFNKIFSPIVKLSTLCFLLGVVTHEDLELLQLDVKKAFLHRHGHRDKLAVFEYMRNRIGSRCSTCKI
jgi:hypothetical protein